jgi:hypothetical protein
MTLFSLSHSRSACVDDNLLSQWTTYGGKSSSFSIGLKSGLLTEGYNYPPKLVKVIYNQDEQRQHVADFVAATYDFATKHSARLGSPSVREAFLTQVSKRASEYLVQFKSPAFASEQEWRLVIRFDRSTGFDTLRYRASRFGITPYINLTPNDEKILLPIGQIRIGPSPHVATTQSGVFAFMTGKGYTHFDLLRSDIPWR